MSAEQKDLAIVNDKENAQRLEPKSAWRAPIISLIDIKRTMKDTGSVSDLGALENI